MLNRLELVLKKIVEREIMDVRTYLRGLNVKTMIMRDPILKLKSSNDVFLSPRRIIGTLSDISPRKASPRNKPNIS
jgi:hypothetical protein